MHRKTRVFPLGEIIAASILLGLAVALLTGLSWLGSPTAAAANPAMFTPAAKVTASLIPYWDGRHPKTWTSEDDPLCVARFHGRHGWLRIDNYGPRVRMECEPIGPPGGRYAWNVITGH
jgi:hypothetical protein